jgi:hypothetical protein
MFILSFVFGHCQKKDTIRIYKYENYVPRFQLILKNDEFTYIARHLNDTLTGRLINANGSYSLFTDTTSLIREKKRLFKGLQNSIYFIRHEDAQAPLLYLSTDTASWFRIDTTDLLPTLTGNYITSTGFVGCEVEVKEDGTISFKPFNDVGAPESKETVRWIQKGQAIKLKGKVYIPAWFTGTKIYYILPYYLIGRKVEQTRTTYKETFHYFIKIAKDR